MEEDQPLGKVVWCPRSTWYIAAIPVEDTRIVVYDIRSMNSPCNYFRGHRHYVNSLEWSQHHDAQVLSTDYTGNVMSCDESNK